MTKMNQAITNTMAKYAHWLKNEALMSELLSLLPSDLILEVSPLGIKLEYQGWYYEGLPRDTLVNYLLHRDGLE